MFKHSLLLIYRNFLRFKSSFFINLIGLSTGLACALSIYLWVNDELSVDRFHENDSRLYQVLENHKNADGINTLRVTAGLLAESLADEMPEVVHAVSVIPSTRNPNLTLTVGDKDIRAAGQFVGKDYFNIFSFPLLEGDKDQVLADKSSMVISEELAMKLFNTTEGVVGRVVEYQHKKQYRISGVVKNIPLHSTQQFDFALSFDQFKENNPWVLEWGNSGTEAYLVLKENTNIAQFNSKITEFLKSKGQNSYRSIFVAPFSEGYLYGSYENGQQAGGRIEYVKLFSIVALFILIIACINFMNLSTARATRKMKEVGVKKAIGASRQSLIFQYLGESILMAFIALVMAMALILLFLPQFNDITGKQISLRFDPGLAVAVVGITLLTGLISGSYPALYLSGFNPIAVLRGGAGSMNASVGELWARKGLVVFQFTLSIVLIIAVIVVYRQIEFIQTEHLGYNKDNIIYFEKEGKVEEKPQLFLSRIRNIPGVMDASATSHELIGHQNATTGLRWEGQNPDEVASFEYIEVDYGLLELLDIEMAAGRTFSADFGADSTAIILNEAAVNVMDFTDPIGKVVNQWGTDKTVIGVVKDFHFQSFHEKVKPLFFSLSSEGAWMVMAKIEGGKEQEAIAGIQKLYQEFNPGFSFDYNFLDQEYEAQYVAEQRVAMLSRYFAGLAILISCLGLYGLAAYAAEQRTKEIGIRKVLGASVANIMTLLSKDFIKLVSIAIVVGSLLSWIAMSKWLEGFAYRIELGWWVFGVAGAAALFIALCTVGYQAVKAATANPVKNLRSE
ncbi:hypothetical protein D770_23095 [Flammeovirgaceae bacterium 311]|nr:hypothetical protein D770_23095 [Flammeovirgaceae bacterium 311]